MKAHYLDRFQIIDRTTGQPIKDFESYSAAVAALGGESKLRDFCTENDCYTAIVQCRVIQRSYDIERTLSWAHQQTYYCFSTGAIVAYCNAVGVRAFEHLDGYVTFGNEAPRFTRELTPADG